MPYTDTPIAAGTMSWTAIQNNLTDFRTWLNSIPNGDLENGAILREHFVRPVILGFPFNGVQSTLQEAWDCSRGMGDFPAMQNTEWGAKRNRDAFVPVINDGLTEQWYTSIARTIRLDRSMYIEAHVDLEWQTRSDTVEYPNGAGGPANAARCGFFAVHWYERATATDNYAVYGKQDVYHRDADGVRSNDTGKVSMVETLDAGTWDIQLVYHRSAAPETLLQIDIGRATLHIEGL